MCVSGARDGRDGCAAGGAGAPGALGCLRAPVEEALQVKLVRLAARIGPIAVDGAQIARIIIIANGALVHV